MVRHVAIAVFFGAVLASAAQATERGMWSELLAVDCQGRTHVLANSPFAVSFDSSSAAHDEFWLNKVLKRAKDRCPQASKDDLLSSVLPSLQMFVRALSGSRTRLPCGGAFDPILNPVEIQSAESILPATCTPETLSEGKGCLLMVPLPGLPDSTLQVAADTCPGSDYRMFLSVTLGGELATFMQPCDTSCDGGLACAAIPGVTEQPLEQGIRATLESMGMLNTAIDDPQCAGVELVRDFKSFLSTEYYGGAPSTSADMKFCGADLFVAAMEGAMMEDGVPPHRRAQTTTFERMATSAYLHLRSLQDRALRFLSSSPSHRRAMSAARDVGHRLARSLSSFRDRAKAFFSPNAEVRSTGSPHGPARALRQDGHAPSPRPADRPAPPPPSSSPAPGDGTHAPDGIDCAWLEEFCMVQSGGNGYESGYDGMAYDGSSAGGDGDEASSNARYGSAYDSDPGHEGYGGGGGGGGGGGRAGSGHHHEGDHGGHDGHGGHPSGGGHCEGCHDPYGYYAAVYDEAPPGYEYAGGDDGDAAGDDDGSAWDSYSESETAYGYATGAAVWELIPAAQAWDGRLDSGTSVLSGDRTSGLLFRTAFHRPRYVGAGRPVFGFKADIASAFVQVSDRLGVSVAMPRVNAALDWWAATMKRVQDCRGSGEALTAEQFRTRFVPWSPEFAMAYGTRLMAPVDWGKDMTDVMFAAGPLVQSRLYTPASCRYSSWVGGDGRCGLGFTGLGEMLDVGQLDLTLLMVKGSYEDGEGLGLLPDMEVQCHGPTCGMVSNLTLCDSGAECGGGMRCVDLVYGTEEGEPEGLDVDPVAEWLWAGSCASCWGPHRSQCSVPTFRSEVREFLATVRNDGGPQDECTPDTSSRVAMCGVDVGRVQADWLEGEVAVDAAGVMRLRHLQGWDGERISPTDDDKVKQDTFTPSTASGNHHHYQTTSPHQEQHGDHAHGAAAATPSGGQGWFGGVLLGAAVGCVVTALSAYVLHLRSRYADVMATRVGGGGEGHVVTAMPVTVRPDASREDPKSLLSADSVAQAAAV